MVPFTYSQASEGPNTSTVDRDIVLCGGAWQSLSEISTLIDKNTIRNSCVNGCPVSQECCPYRIFCRICGRNCTGLNRVSSYSIFSTGLLRGTLHQPALFFVEPSSFHSQNVRGAWVVLAGFSGRDRIASLSIPMASTSLNNLVALGWRSFYAAWWDGLDQIMPWSVCICGRTSRFWQIFPGRLPTRICTARHGRHPSSVWRVNFSLCMESMILCPSYPFQYLL